MDGLTKDWSVTLLLVLLLVPSGKSGKTVTAVGLFLCRLCYLLLWHRRRHTPWEGVVAQLPKPLLRVPASRAEVPGIRDLLPFLIERAASRHPGKQQVVTPIPLFLSSVWETHARILTPVSGLTQSWLFLPVDGRSLCLPFALPYK